jgi:hypothetical protein
MATTGLTDSPPSSDFILTKASSVNVKSDCGSYFDSYIEEHNFGSSCCKLHRVASVCMCMCKREII